MLIILLLINMKIGHIDQNEPSPVFDADDPYANEPERHPALHVHKAKPFNAETPVMLISDNYITTSKQKKKRTNPGGGPPRATSYPRPAHRKKKRQ